jgi:hypothetical protein
MSALRTRSRASDTALSGRPTTLKAGKPGATCTWTSTARASMPSNATVETRWTILFPSRGKFIPLMFPVQEQLQNKTSRVMLLTLR